MEKEKIKEEVTEMNRVFFCEICSKQYTQALQYDQHLSSYDHHHKKVGLMNRIDQMAVLDA